MAERTLAVAVPGDGVRGRSTKTAGQTSRAASKVVADGERDRGAMAKTCESDSLPLLVPMLMPSYRQLLTLLKRLPLIINTPAVLEAF